MLQKPEDRSYLVLQGEFTAFFCCLLIVNAFVSKVGFVHGKIPPLINMGVSATLSLLCLSSILLFQNREKFSANKAYFILMVSIAGLLLAQMFFRNHIFEILGVMSTLNLLFIFGLVIPRFLPLNLFRKLLGNLLTISIVSSLLLIFIEERTVGGRFQGVFIDPSIMSSVSAIGFVFFGTLAIAKQKWSLFALTCLSLLLIFYAGGRSSLIGAVTTILFFLLFTGVQLSSFWVFARKWGRVFLLPVSPVALWFLYNLGTGKITFHTRSHITNGFADRWQHWKHGIERIYDNLILGDGVLTKFKSNGEIAINLFSEGRDPHNVLVYAGNVGGVGLVLLIGIFLVKLLLFAIKAIRSSDLNLNLIGCCMISFIIVMPFGGSLFSLASLSDRLFWVVSGYLFLYLKTTVYPLNNSENKEI